MQTEGSKDKQQGGGAAQGNRTDAPAPADTQTSGGRPLENVGGAGLGQPPGAGDTPAGSHPPEKKAADPQDRRDGKG